MKLEAAIIQYAEMVVLGSYALERVTRQKENEPRLSELAAHVEEIRQLAEKLKFVVESGGRDV